MNKLIGLTLMIVSAMVLPVRASLITFDSWEATHLPGQDVPQLSVTESSVQKASMGSLANTEQMEAPVQKFVMSMNSLQQRQGNPLASTELRINLDNFDMEYVLKVQ